MLKKFLAKIKSWLRRERPVATLSTASPENAEAINALRQNLRVKVLYNEAVIDRLVDSERARNPNAGESLWLRAAIERWERDNR